MFKIFIYFYFLFLFPSSCSMSSSAPAVKRPREIIKDDPTVTMQSCPLSGALGVAFGPTLLVARFCPTSASPTSVACINCSVGANVDSSSEESIRAFKFLPVVKGCMVSTSSTTNVQNEDCSPYAIVAGDEKCVKLVDLTNESTSAIVSSVGPFTKKITNIEIYIPHGPAEMATYPPNYVATVVLADKFGDVQSIYVQRSRSGLELVRPPAGSPGYVHISKPIIDNDETKNGTAPAANSDDDDDDDKAQFLLQHMSVLSQLLITSYPSHNRRLITADKDCHTRVSAFPHSYVIDQFLWPNHGGEEQAPVSALIELSLGNVSDATALVMGDSLGRVTFWSSNNELAQESNESPVFVQAGTIALASLYKERITSAISNGSTTASSTGKAYLQRGKQLGTVVAKQRNTAKYEAADDAHVAARLSSAEVDKWMLEQHLMCKHSSIGGVVGIAQVSFAPDTGVVVALEGAPFLIYIPFLASAGGITADTANVQVIELPEACPAVGLVNYAKASDHADRKAGDRVMVLLRNGTFLWVTKTATVIVVETLENNALIAHTVGDEPFKSQLGSADPFMVWKSVYHEKMFAQKLVLDAIQTGTN